MYHLFFLNQPCPAPRATWPPPTTAPIPALLPAGRRLKAAVSGAHVLGAGGNTALPVAGSIFFSSMDFQLSSSSSGHSSLNFFPPSPALMAPKPLPLLPVVLTPGMVRDDEPPPVLFHQREREAKSLRSASVADSEPVVISSLVMKLCRPSRMVLTSQAGLKLLGWKSLMLRHSLVDGWKRPLGVCIRMAGGANG